MKGENKMSEFTDCYHLRTDNQEEGISLLKRTGLKGYIFPAANGWVTLVSEKYDFEENEELIKENEGILLHFVYGDDHGWYFTVYEKEKEICHYSNMWEEEIEDDSRFDEEYIYKLIQENESKDREIEREELQSILEDPQEFADLIGLTNYEWISYHYIDMESERGEDVYEGVIKIE